MTKRKSREARALDMFRNGHLAPSQIDRELDMMPGTTRHIVVAWWIDEWGDVTESHHAYMKQIGREVE